MSLISEMDNRLSQLIKEIERKELECRVLRKDVEVLENAQNMKVFSSSIDGQRKACIPVPDESLKELFEARNVLKGLRTGNKVLRENYDKVQRLCDHNIAESQKMAKNLEDMEETACWKPGNLHGYVDPMQMGNLCEALKKEIDAEITDKDTAIKEYGRLTKEIEKITKEISERADVERELFQRQTDLKIEEQKLRSINDEINSYQRILVKKEKMVEKLIVEKDDTREIRQLECKKRLSAQKLSKHLDQIRQNEVMIRSQGIRIHKLEDKIELLGEAIRGDDNLEADRIDAAALSQVQADITQFNKICAERDEELQLLDAKVESFEACVKTLNHAAEVAKRDIKKNHSKHRQQVKKLNEHVAELTLNAEMVMDSHRQKIEEEERETTMSHRTFSEQFRADAVMWKAEDDEKRAEDKNETTTEEETFLLQTEVFEKKWDVDNEEKK